MRHVAHRGHLSSALCGACQVGMVPLSAAQNSACYPCYYLRGFGLYYFVRYSPRANGPSTRFHTQKCSGLSGCSLGMPSRIRFLSGSRNKFRSLNVGSYGFVRFFNPLEKFVEDFPFGAWISNFLVLLLDMYKEF